MKAFDDPADLIDEIDEAKTCLMQRVIFWPRRWQGFHPPAGIRWDWKSVPFDENASAQVPNDEHGLYTFVLSPKVADHPMNHFILYIGKADKMTLRQRFMSYFQEMRKIKRPPICYVLNKYSGYIHFCFTKVINENEIESGEDSLLAALMPPCNSDFPAEVSQIIRGIR